MHDCSSFARVVDGQWNLSCAILFYGKEMTAETEMKIAIEDPSQPEIIMLLRDGEQHSANLYPAASNLLTWINSILSAPWSSLDAGHNGRLA